MPKILYKKYDKKKIAALPRVNFEGRIVVILTEGETRKAVDYLLTQPILGIDTEKAIETLKNVSVSKKISYFSFFCALIKNSNIGIIFKIVCKTISYPFSDFLISL